MIKLGLIGYPLSHSLSAIIHNAAFKHFNIDGEYEILETPPEDLVNRIKFLKSNDYKGFNVTIPLKVPVTLFVDKVDNAANVSGSINTVKIMPDKSLYGFNTDIYGFKMAIPQELQAALKNRKAIILGTGGAARACAIALVQLGINEIDFYARNIINSSEMVNFLRKQFPNTPMALKQFQSLGNLSSCAIIVNCTPVGMKNVSMDESLLNEYQIKNLSPDAIVYDIVYNPIKTKMIELAEAQGLKTITGLDMLIYQAIKAFEIWTDKKPSYEMIKIAVLESLFLK